MFQKATYVLGIDEGPMQSLTGKFVFIMIGKLRYCDDSGECSILYSSTKEYFLLYYDVYVYSPDSFVVVTLDFQYIEVWLNPQLPSNTTINQTVSCNYSIYLP